MDRNQTIFLGFLGPAIEQEQAVFEIAEGYECWDLKKFTFDEFIDLLKNKIPPVNDNVLRNYEVSENERGQLGLTRKQFEQCSWGLLIPDCIEDAIASNYGETLFLLNLYSPSFLYPLFYA